jgi:hypothetical protein
MLLILLVGFVYLPVIALYATGDIETIRFIIITISVVGFTFLAYKFDWE